MLVLHAFEPLQRGPDLGHKARGYGDGTILTVRVSTGFVRSIHRQGDRGGWWQCGLRRLLYDSAWVKPGVQPSGEEHCVRNPRRIRVLRVDYRGGESVILSR